MARPTIERNIKRLGALGLQVAFTEVDFRINPVPASPAALAVLKQNYYDLMKVCSNNSNCKSFITWGLNDGQSWVPNFFKGTGEALPFAGLVNGVYNRKPAYDGMMEALKDSPLKPVNLAPHRTKKVNPNSAGWNGRPAYVIPGSRSLDLSGNRKAYNSLGKVVGYQKQGTTEVARPKKSK